MTRRTKLVHATGRESDLNEQVEKALKQYKIGRDDIIEIRLSKSGSTETALIIYEYRNEGEI